MFSKLNSNEQYNGYPSWSRWSSWFDRGFFMSLIAVCFVISPVQPQASVPEGGAPEWDAPEWDANDARLQNGNNDLTIWDLQNMAKTLEGEQRIDELFRQGLRMKRLPYGYAAGTGAKVLGLDEHSNDPRGNLAKFMVDYIGENWRGKIFYNCQKDPNYGADASHGMNRIRYRALLASFADDKDGVVAKHFGIVANTLGGKEATNVVPIAKFKTFLRDSDTLTPDINPGTNLVVLTYADPVTQWKMDFHKAFSLIHYWQEEVLKRLLQVYDVMVAVAGKYGPIYIGKTWIGRYDDNGEFTASNPDQLFARFFMDFNPGGLLEQRTQHWAGGEEVDGQNTSTCPEPRSIQKPRSIFRKSRQAGN